MMTREGCEATLLAHLPRIQRAMVAACRELARLTVDAVEGAGADALVAAAEADGERRRLAAALADALAALSPDDQRLLRMHFWDGLTVAEAARRLGVPQKPLYRRIERALVTLRDRLEADGVSRGALAAVGDQEAA